MKKITNIFFLSSEWKYYHRKGFTLEFAKTYKDSSYTMLVESPVSITVNLFYKFKQRLLPYLSGKFKPYKMNEHIFLIRPLILFHPNFWIKFTILAHIDTWLINRQLIKFIKKNNLPERIHLWVFMPSQYLMVKNLNYEKLIYDSYDDNELDYEGKVLPKQKFYNEKLINISDLTICLAKYTYERYSNYNGNLIYLPNGNSFTIFEQKTDKQLPEKLTGIKKPIVGYLGAIRSWIDFDLIERLLSEVPECQVVFVGYINKDVTDKMRKMFKNENFTHLDFVEFTEIATYLRSFSIGIIPFKVNNFTSSVFPNKFFEYMAAALPIVTTALPELKPYKEYCKYSETNDEFIQNCKNILWCSDNSQFKVYSKIAKENDWSHRIETLRPYISEFLK